MTENKKFNDLIQHKCDKIREEILTKLKGVNIYGFQFIINFTEEELNKYNLNNNIDYICDCKPSRISVKPCYCGYEINLNSYIVSDDNYIKIIDILRECVKQDTNKPVITDDMRVAYMRKYKLEQIKNTK